VNSLAGPPLPPALAQAKYCDELLQPTGQYFRQNLAHWDPRLAGVKLWRVGLIDEGRASLYGRMPLATSR